MSVSKAAPYVVVLSTAAIIVVLFVQYDWDFVNFRANRLRLLDSLSDSPLKTMNNYEKLEPKFVNEKFAYWAAYYDRRRSSVVVLDK